VSHLRFGPRPIRAPYLVGQASFVGCHHFGLLDRVDVLGRAAPGAALLLDCAQPPDQVWAALPRPVQEKILAKRIEVYAIDAGRIARDVGLAGRTNTILQTCFFRISGVLPRRKRSQDQVSDRQDLRRRGTEVVSGTWPRRSRTLEALHQIECPAGSRPTGSCPRSCRPARRSSSVPSPRDDGRPR
jgi:pyruvate-ferredoxin/flavodoxin oxidoreductase